LPLPDEHEGDTQRKNQGKGGSNEGVKDGRIFKRGGGVTWGAKRQEEKEKAFLKLKLAENTFTGKALQEVKRRFERSIMRLPTSPGGVGPEN